jgi:DNA-directed RNA polymerase subunit RPC12/RpoP
MRDKPKNKERNGMSAREKIAYLRGLIEGQNLTENAGMSKFHEALLGAFDSIMEEMDELASEQTDLREYVEDLEDELLSLDADETCSCENDEEDGEDEEEEYEPVTCPECGKDFFYQPDVYDDDEDLLCPHCGKPFKQ